MVLKLKVASPVKFYGSSLPRPRFYTDVKFSDERVDPPTPVLDPLLSWAHEAHWSMGGLSFKRLRFQGHIEGNVGKLCAEREKIEKKKLKQELVDSSSAPNVGPRGKSKGKRVASDDSPPPPPVASKRRRFLALIDEDDDEDEVGVDVDEEEVVKEKRLVKKLADEFDRVAMEGGRGSSANGSPVKSLSGGSESVASRTRRSRKLEVDDETVSVMKVVEEVNKLSFKGKKLKGKNRGKENKQTVSGNASGTRTSPRLASRS